MVRKDGKYLKQQRMQDISKAIAKSFPDGLDYDKLINQLEFRGYREDTAIKYVDVVIKFQGWIIVDGTIKPNLS